MVLEIRQVQPSDVEMMEGIRIDMPALAYIGVDNGEVVGSGGLAWGVGRCWVFLHINQSRPQYAIPLMRKTRELISKAWQFGERTVFTPRDAQYGTSEKLLKVLGFKLHAIENEIEVWSFERV